ncbi:tryptophan halogenase family protein [Shewanella salipaludis]|uniref:Tryptophan 7-halogenase n=1 Tax=Shewanella salipaludis TaxID=2723052 RepID=A0A972FT48_9GAMM|nr:tryptophan halogenase family protein [Shewanella salipaludis]NMH64729.1 tryptophan 7-halogenase [Shewanella salipaludis]
MEKQTIDRVAIVGGGTAGWLAAAILAKKLNSLDPDGVQLTLIESPDIPILGVGEGTWPTIRSTLQSIGVDESEFMRECDATFKQGAEFVNWRETPLKGSKHSYFHPLSAVFHSAYDFNLAPYWLLGQSPQPYDMATTTQSRISRLGLAPKKITTPSYGAIQNYSYHLNATKFADFLKRHCTQKLGVKFICANVIEVEQAGSGAISSLVTDTRGRVDADFFVDCSGSRAILLGQALNVGWHKIDDIIFNDTALAMQVPYSSPDAPIASHTIATAHEAGWTWDIGLHNRRGVGYVYSSRHSSAERAEAVLRDYVGAESEGLEVRKIPLNLGYREEFWKHNCVAIGMSAAFIEPLEASAIFLVEAAANMLADTFPRRRASLDYAGRKFNATFKLRWDKSIDFIKLHYCISGRRDSQYWRDNVAPTSIPDSLQEKLTQWRHHPPSKHDFDYAFEPFVLDSYLFVLYGMGFNTDLSANRSAFSDGEQALQKFAEIDKLSERLMAELPSHRHLLEKVYRFGFQTI